MLIFRIKTYNFQFHIREVPSGTHKIWTWYVVGSLWFRDSDMQTTMTCIYISFNCSIQRKPTKVRHKCCGLYAQQTFQAYTIALKAMYEKANACIIFFNNG